MDGTNECEDAIRGVGITPSTLTNATERCIGCRLKNARRLCVRRMIHHHARPEDPPMAANRLHTLSPELWTRLEAAGEPVQRQVAAVVAGLAMQAAPIEQGINETRQAIAAGAYGDSDLRAWLKQASSRANVASHEADQLDGDRAQAREHWKIARAYQAAYFALDTDPAEAAGEAAYEAARVAPREEVLTTIQRILAGDG
jgi:hypothetical protein